MSLPYFERASINGGIYLRIGEEEAELTRIDPDYYVAWQVWVEYQWKRMGGLLYKGVPIVPEDEADAVDLYMNREVSKCPR